MKLVYSFLAVLFVSGTALACPDLSGDWICQGDADKEKVKMHLNSINKEDINMLLITSDVGTKVQTSDSLYLNVGRQKAKDYHYRANCNGSSSVVVDLETVFGNSRVVYNRIRHNELQISVSSKSHSEVMSCSTNSLLD